MMYRKMSIFMGIGEKKSFFNLVRIENFLKKKFSRGIYLFSITINFLIGRKINERGDMIFPPSLLCTKHVDLFMIARKTNERERGKGRERLTVKRRIVVGCAENFSGPWFARRQHPPAGWIFCLASQG